MKAVAAVLLLLALAASYYFCISLPAHNRAVLDFEKKKYADQQAEAKEKAEESQKAEQIRRYQLNLCIDQANYDYAADVRSNGSPNSKGGYSVNLEVNNGLERRKEAAIAEYHRQYGH